MTKAGSQDLQHDGFFGKRDGENRDAAQPVDLAHEGDEQEERGDDHVAREHVREETDHEGERLREHADDLDRHHDGQQPHRDAGRDEVAEVPHDAVPRDAPVLLRRDAIRVLWPDGSAEVFPGTRADQHLTLRKGAGRNP